MKEGALVDIYTLTNANGMEASVTNYGGALVSLRTPDRAGAPGDVVLGYGALEEYIHGNFFFGAIIGRCANRIADGKFTLNDVPYALMKNEGPNHLHGGLHGFDKMVWSAEAVEGEEGAGLALAHRSRNGEQGYPGDLTVTVFYTLTDADELKIDYTAVADRDTVVNLTSHGYFNLAGAGSGDILEHEIMINADRFTPIDKHLIPTGELRPVKGAPMDFTRSTKAGARIEENDNQLRRARGYDHNWVLNNPNGLSDLAARVYESTSGRVMEVYTTEPGLQFYTGNFIKNGIAGKNGAVYNRRGGFCLEAQHFPDSPNQPDFPSTRLRAGE
ncbi:MAG: galactose mutarotase, partial [Desulfobacterales bacterium]|nr:galactose mutarotase [Desulfobacterales bacterium]